MTIVQRLMLVVLLVAVPLALLQAYGVRQERAEQHAESEQRALRMAYRAAAEQQRIGDGARQLLTALAQIPAVRAGDARNCSTMLRRLQAQFPTYLAIGVANPAGRVWCSSATPGTDVSDRAYFKEALSSRRFVAGGYIIGRLNNRRSLNFSLGFEDPGGGSGGVIIAGLDLDRLAADIGRNRLSAGSRLTLVGPDRRILVDLPGDARVGEMLPPYFEPMFTAARPGIRRGRWLDGSDRIIGFVPPRTDARTPFLVAVGIDREQALSAVRARSERQALVLALTILAAVLLAWWSATRFVRRPIVRLAHAMRAWNAGDFAVRIGRLNPGSEFDDLAHGFDTLAEELEARQRRLLDTLKSTTDIVVMIARDWRVTFMNEKARAILTDVHLLGRDLWEVFPHVAAMPVGRALQQAMSDRRPQTIAYELQPYGHFDAHIFPDPEEGLTLFIRDVTEERAAQKALRDLALNDRLTGLPNRVHAIELAEQEAAAGRLGGMLLVDIDGFKHVNDLFGQYAGDDVLRDIAIRLSSRIDGRGIVARLGADEFLVLLFNGGASEPAEVAAALLSDIEIDPFVVHGLRYSLRANGGFVAVAPRAMESIEELLANAGLALHRAKVAGGGAYHIYSAADRERYEADRHLEEELAQASAREEFELHYQPQVRLHDGRIVGAEALLRWRHPRRGLIEPCEFIDLLGRSRYASAVGDWILDGACRQAAAWRDAGHPLRVGVNLFPAQLASEGLAERIGAALRIHGLNPALLELELTEDIALDRRHGEMADLLALRDLGVSLAFDDFGTGFASLTTLKAVPVDRLKLDRSFVSELPRDEHDKAIVEAVLALARTLGLEVVAEGVETAAQEDYLRTRGCQEAQGFLYGKPMPADVFSTLLGLPGGALSAPAAS